MSPTSSGPSRSRPGREADVPAITEIYNDAVLTTTGTFDTEPRSLADRIDWFRHHSLRHPILVADDAAEILGWASLSPWSDRPAYDATAEVSVYVRRSAQGRGIGTHLLAELLRAARDAGHHALLARVAEGNDASLRLHRSAGFFEVGVMREVGVKFGRRLDVHLLEALLGANGAGTVPEPAQSRP